MIKWFLLSLVAGSILATTGFGSASSLSLEGGTLQAGGSAALRCQQSALTLEYQGVAGTEWNSVSVSGIDSACTGPIAVSVSVHANGQRIADGSSACLPAAQTAQVPFTDPITRQESGESTGAIASVEIIRCGT